MWLVSLPEVPKLHFVQQFTSINNALNKRINTLKGKQL